jgi:hypothetical protein
MPQTLELMQKINTLSGRHEYSVALKLVDEIISADRNEPDVLRAEAGLAAATGELSRAETACGRLTNLIPNSDDLVTLGTLRLQLGRNGDAAEAFRRAAILDRRSPRIWVSLGVALHRMGSLTDATIAYREAISLEAAAAAKKWNIETALPIEIEPGRATRLLSDNSKICPSIFLSPLQKSGSTWLHQVLLSTLGYLPISCSSEQFPDDLLHWRRMMDFAAGGFVARNHIPARPENLWLLQAFRINPIVLVRDPRQILWSWVHHLSRANRHNEGYTTTVHSPPDQWFSAPVEKRVDWVIEHHLSKFCDWISGWVDAAAANLDVLFIDYRDLLRDMPETVRRILAHQGIEIDQLEVAPVQPGRETNFRSGQPNEWREAMTPAQRAISTKMIPDALFERFGWTR